MKAILIFLISLLYSLHMGYGISNHIHDKLINDRPIIGVLAQELPDTFEDAYGQYNYSSHIVASYVKYLEGAGARVVPIMINQDQAYYEYIINSTNGLLIPGGGNWNNESGYGAAGEKLFKLAVSLNNQGDFYPVWGTCLGFELLIYLMANKDDPRIACDGWDRANSIKFEPDAINSKMFSTAPVDVVNILSNEAVTSNFHHACVTKEGLNAKGLDTILNVLSTSLDGNSLTYVSAYEARELPIYGVQFHPEKPLFEWNTDELSIPHSARSIKVSTYFGEFFVNEARKNFHRFPSKEEESRYLIYNHPATYTGAKNIVYEQCYFFK